jgi:predicted DNA-binding protein (UPF0251 family)
MSTKQIAWVALAIALMRDRYTTPEGAWELAEGIPHKEVEEHEWPRLALVAADLKLRMTFHQVGAAMGLSKHTVAKYLKRIREGT